MAAGVELGAHTVTHPDMSLLDRAGCLREMAESRRALQERFDVPALHVRLPVLPLRAGAPWPRRAMRASSRRSPARAAADGSRYELRRAMITGKDGMPSFLLKLVDAYHPLWGSPPGRALRTSTRAVRGRVRAATGR